MSKQWSTSSFRNGALSFLAGSLLTFSTLALHAAEPSTDGSIWFWFSDCGQNKLALEVTLDRTVLYKTTFSICKADRQAYLKSPNPTLRFTFKPKRPITWTGYREPAETTGRKYSLEGNVWLAGAEPTGLLLGVSFQSPKQIHMNSLHTASPTQESRTEIEPGLIVITKPIDLVPTP